MTIRETLASGIEALNLATALLQRNRLADPYAGVFEAADVQWAWRKPRSSDHAQETFWLDDEGPVAGIVLTSSSDRRWQIDPVIVPGTPAITLEDIWQNLTQYINEHPSITFTVPVSDEDPVSTNLARDAGFHPTDRDFTGWMDATNRPRPIELPDGFTLVDRSQQPNREHPMSDLNGEHIGERLQQCSLYDPALDLSAQAPNGEIAGYSLYWMDPVTRVGLVEPVRVHDAYQRKGLARAMLTHGIDRLVARGAERIKVSWETEAAGALYLGAGFRQTSTTTWHTTRHH